MNIYSLIINTFNGHPPSSAPADTQPPARRAPRPTKGPQSISFGPANSKSPASSSTTAKADTTDGKQPLQELLSLVRSMVTAIETLLAGLDEKKTPPDAKPTPTPTPKDLPDNAPKPGKPYTPDALINGFSQKRGSMNCVTVAGIKAAMQRFGGPKEVYASVEQTKDGVDVKMRDAPNKTFHVTTAELKYAAAHSGFKGSNQKMLNDANFMYAVSAKRAQMENNDGTASRSFAAAVKTLDTWEHTQEGLQRLGLRNYVQRTSAKELANGTPGVMAQNDHVFTVLNGRIENYGNLGSRPNGWAEAYKLK
ncbi:hypothetical protein F0169_04500 [Pseudomonas sp. MAFF 212408]|uniref:Type III secretion effector protein n=1 Tax=Pseudomonas kitaguniensis TaxID=2607908 RepID=A0A5N7KH68_9PSED|nr:hypothetical protein [Pseudomonas kitaguniensis]MPR01400.1 hypothetical protein [Pseudomonas kitaguniensis]